MYIEGIATRKQDAVTFTPKSGGTNELGIDNRVWECVGNPGSTVVPVWGKSWVTYMIFPNRVEPSAGGMPAQGHQCYPSKGTAGRGGSGTRCPHQGVVSWVQRDRSVRPVGDLFNTLEDCSIPLFLLCTTVNDFLNVDLGVREKSAISIYGPLLDIFQPILETGL